MSGLFKQFKTNSTKEVEGVEIEFPEAQNDDGTVPTFVISRMGKSNKAQEKPTWQRAICFFMTQHRRFASAWVVPKTT